MFSIQIAGLARSVEERAFWLGIMAPMGLLVLSLKFWRIMERGHVPQWWAGLDLIRSEVLVLAALAAFGLIALRLSRGRLKRPLVLAVLSAFAIGWAALEIVAHHFFMVTGSTFDLHILFFSLGRFNETFSVVASEVPGGTWVFLGIVVAVLAALPWGIRAYLLSKAPAPSEDQARPGASNGSRGLIWTGLVGVFCVFFALLPPIHEDYVAFGRASLVNMVLSIQDVRGVEMVDVVREPLHHLRLEEGYESQESPRNIAIIILESTRARSMTVYDPELDTTPFLADLAGRSTVADRAYAVVPHTSKALVAILCGLEPRLRMPITEALTDGIPARCLAELLGDQGYRSVFFQSATERFEDRPGLVENMGFDDFIPVEMMNTRGYERANYFGYEDAVMLPSSQEWLSDVGDRPFLAAYLTLTPHHDYLAPRRRFGRRDFVEDDELNRYKNTIYYVDQFVRELMEQYQAQGVYEDTIFVIVGDHGEGFEEHGRSQHDNVIWEEGIHVPLMVYDPRRPDGERIAYPVSQIDIVPTVIDWLGFDVEGGSYSGMPIDETHEDRTVFAHCWYERRCMAQVGWRYKYIDHFGRQSPEVYDIIEDPMETRNLAGEMDEEARQWRAEVYGWREAVNSLYRREQSDLVSENLVDELPEDVVAMDFELGDYVRYRGYGLSENEARRGARLTVTHYFEVLRTPPPGWLLFVHGDGGGRMLNLDHVPVQGLHPLDEWEPGTIVADEHSFRIPRDWSPGVFSLYLGIYHRDEGRLPIRGEVETDGEDRARIFEIPIP